MAENKNVPLTSSNTRDIKKPNRPPGENDRTMSTEPGTKGLPVFDGNERVKFRVEYAKDFKGERYMTEGGEPQEFHILHATKLEQKGYGKIVR